MSLSLFDDAFFPLASFGDPFFRRDFKDVMPRQSYDLAKNSRFGATDVTEHSDGSLEFHVDAPGLAKDDYSIEVSPDNLLTISGERKTSTESEEPMDNGGKRAAAADKPVKRWSERTYCSFKRSWRLPETADVDGITASVTDGVLTLGVPAVAPEPAPEPRRIRVD
eukprot:CAMPEP_0182915612 /NCGR_PEP_ID=MMETSP0105_2-20130417/416_1 /TAXON_ID=81532 ORGANISM="Acanthoeca-like sp., Strain 10tr" /NCGR_SAMPLE_ID=MMETSP0105_2 /ASSEMBLY_ACC=CAM_ASM_000205 /LENGTH=165 /DNA_ID=CAMNT_0025052487 /DNA_START=68 /DNA_END=565 /DNA_ORIENTATION=-